MAKNMVRPALVVLFIDTFPAYPAQYGHSAANLATIASAQYGSNSSSVYRINQTDGADETPLSTASRRPEKKGQKKQPILSTEIDGDLITTLEKVVRQVDGVDDEDDDEGSGENIAGLVAVF